MVSSAALRALCVAIVAVVPPLLAGAQTAPTPSPSPSGEPEIAHVETSDRSYESLASAARTTYIVTQAEMLREGYLDVADAIATLPGVNLVRYGPGAGAATINIRGGSSLQTLVLINGEPAPGGQIDSVDLAAIPTDGVERIEVVEGGGSTLYGSGSVGGIINIITTPLNATVVDATAGSFGQQDFRIQAPTFSFQRSVGAENYPLPDGTSQINDAYSITNGRLAYDRMVGDVSAQLTAGITDRHQGVPGPNDFLSATSAQDDVTRDAQLSLANTHGRATTTLDLSASDLNLAYTCDTPVDSACPNSFAFPLTPYAQLLTEMRQEVSLRSVIDERSSTIVAGVDLSRGIARVDDGCDPLQIHPFAQTALYVQDKWTIAGSNYVYAGVRAERDTTLGAASGGAISPSIGGIVALSKSISVRANAATAFRAPTADDLYYPFFSNPKLVPERTQVGDLTITDDALLGGVSLGWFGISGTNLIVDNADFIPENVGHASIAGLTFTAKTRPVKGIYTSVNVTNLYSAQDLDTNPAADIYSGERIPSRGPVFQANLELGYIGTNRIIESAAIEMRTQGPRGYVDPYVPLFDQPVAYSRLDAFVRIRAGTRALVTLRGFNLGDERYAEIAGYPMPGRSFAVELSSR